jgi:hypothetical protein
MFNFLKDGNSKFSKDEKGNAQEESRGENE